MKIELQIEPRVIHSELKRLGGEAVHAALCLFERGCSALERLLSPKTAPYVSRKRP